MFNGFFKKLFGSDKRPDVEQNKERRHSFEEIPRSEKVHHTRSKGKKRSSPEPKRRKSHDSSSDFTNLEDTDLRPITQSSPDSQNSPDKSEWIDVVDGTETTYSDQNNSAVEEITINDEKKENKMQSSCEASFENIVTTSQCQEKDEISEKPDGANMMRSVWENVETLHTKEHMYKDCVVIETTSEQGDKFAKDSVLPFPEMTDDDSVRLSTGSFINIEGACEQSGSKLVENVGLMMEDSSILSTGGLINVETASFDHVFKENNYNKNSISPSEKKSNGDENFENIDFIQDESSILPYSENKSKGDEHNKKTEKSVIDNDAKYVVPKMPVTKGKGGNKLGQSGKQLEGKLEHKKDRKHRRTPEKVATKKVEVISPAQDSLPVEHLRDTLRSDEQEDTGEKIEMLEITKTDEKGSEKLEAMSSKPKEKYVIPSKRNKDSTVSSENVVRKQEDELTSEPKNYLEIIQSKTARGIIEDAKKLMFELGFLKGVDQTDIEAAVINQYKLAAERKYFAWIKQARFNAELIFSQDWIEENLATVGGKKDKRSDWKKKKQDRRQAHSSEYKSSGGMCKDVRLETDPSLQVIRENLGTDNINDKTSNKMVPDNKASVVQTNENMFGLKYTDAKLETNPNLKEVKENAADKTMQSQGSKADTEITSPLKYSDVRLETNPNLEVVRENAAYKKKQSQGLKADKERASRFKYSDVRLETNPNLEVVRENAADKKKQLHGSEANAERTSRFKYSDVRLETNQNLEVVRENAANKKKQLQGSKADPERTSRFKYSDVRLETNPNLEVVRENAADNKKQLQGSKADAERTSQFKYSDVRLETNPNLEVVRENAANKKQQSQGSKADKERTSQVKYSDVRLETNPYFEVVRENAADLQNKADGQNIDQHNLSSSPLKYTDVRLESNSDLPVIQENVADKQELSTKRHSSGFTESSGSPKFHCTDAGLETNNDIQAVPENELKYVNEPNDTKPLVEQINLPSLQEQSNLDGGSKSEQNIFFDKAKDKEELLHGSNSIQNPEVIVASDTFDKLKSEATTSDLKIRKSATKVGTYINYSAAVKASSNLNGCEVTSEKEPVNDDGKKQVSSSLNSLLALVESEISRKIDGNGNPVSTVDSGDEQVTSDKCRVIREHSYVTSDQICKVEDVMECIISEVKIKEEGEGFIINATLTESYKEVEGSDEGSGEVTPPETQENLETSSDKQNVNENQVGGPVQTDSYKDSYVAALGLVQTQDNKMTKDDTQIIEPEDRILSYKTEVSHECDKVDKTENGILESYEVKDNGDKISGVTTVRKDLCHLEMTKSSADVEVTHSYLTGVNAMALLTESVQAIVKDTSVLNTQQILEDLAKDAFLIEENDQSEHLDTDTNKKLTNSDILLTQSVQTIVDDIVVSETQQKLELLATEMNRNFEQLTEIDLCERNLDAIGCERFATEAPVLTQSVLSAVGNETERNQQWSLQPMEIKVEQVKDDLSFTDTDMMQTDIRFIEKGLKDLITEMAAKEKNTNEEECTSNNSDLTENDSKLSPMSAFGNTRPSMIRSCEYLHEDNDHISEADSLENLSVKSDGAGPSYSQKTSRIQQPKEHYSYARSYESPSKVSFRNKNWHHPFTPNRYGSSRHDACKQSTSSRYDNSFYSNPHHGQHDSYSSKHPLSYSRGSEQSFRGRGSYGSTPQRMQKTQEHHTTEMHKTNHSYSKHSDGGSFSAKKNVKLTFKSSTVEEFRKSGKEEKNLESSKTQARKWTDEGRVVDKEKVDTQNGQKSGEKPKKELHFVHVSAKSTDTKPELHTSTCKPSQSFHQHEKTRHTKLTGVKEHTVMTSEMEVKDSVDKFLDGKAVPNDVKGSNEAHCSSEDGISKASASSQKSKQRKKRRSGAKYKW